MSIVFIKEHNENIYGIQDVVNESSSKHHIKPIDETKLAKCSQSITPIPKVQPKLTFKSSKPDPKHFLRKRIPPKPCLKLTRKRFLTKPAVPETIKTVQEQDEKLKFIPPNVIRRNIQNAVNSKPKSPERAVVIDEHGTRKKLSEALEVTYINKKAFAKLPEFVTLEKIMKEKKKLKEKWKSATAQKPKCRYIVRDSRKKLLNGLKNNWEELQRQYQKLPILMDTLPKKNRKSQLESELKQIEKDIVFLERHPYIYVYDNDEFLG
nr:enkurin-like [Onthophagus taurus]